jgi:hypothetical protein
VVACKVGVEVDVWHAESMSAASRKILPSKEREIFRSMGFSCGSKNPVTKDKVN